ncbi:GNAT family N-acetyltransferase [Planctomonas psychrotolerans]|uniref:GNAT family N-acetyltransferase n=1 Tax=Planctomonas psychrotolerans TaxID=2528712 RepID=UPI001239F36F|nr:GNAT family N-acetyltransferase [Planctomonas psychrotolerans]
MTEPRIVTASPDDTARIARLAGLTFALACPPGTASSAIEQFIEENLSEECFDRYLRDPARQLLVADVKGTAVGYTMLVFGDPADEDVATAISLRPAVELSKVYVLETHHGGGVAATLMASTLDAARDRGASGVWLGVNQQNQRAIRFYTKSGFRIVGSKTFFVGPEKQSDHVLERRL